MNIELNRNTFESNAKECISIIKANDIKYISFFENSVLEIIFHPTENEVLTFEINLDVLNNWSRSLKISARDLVVIAEELNLPETIIAPSMYSTDGSANVIHSSPLCNDWEYDEIRMEIPVERVYL